MCLLFVLGCEFHDVSFGPGQTKGSWSSELHPDRENWSFYSYIGGGHTGTVFPSTIRNPNKAICTINSKTSEVMMRPLQTQNLWSWCTRNCQVHFFLGKKPGFDCCWYVFFRSLLQMIWLVNSLGMKQRSCWAKNSRTLSS